MVEDKEEIEVGIEEVWQQGAKRQELRNDQRRSQLNYRDSYVN